MRSEHHVHGATHQRTTLSDAEPLPSYPAVLEAQQSGPVGWRVLSLAAIGLLAGVFGYYSR